MSEEAAGTSQETAQTPPVRIWKYEVVVTDRQTIELPRQHQILHVDEDPMGAGRLALWAAVRPVPDEKLVPVKLVVFGTGHPFPPEGELSHLGTVISQGFCWHVFRDHDGEPDAVAQAFELLFGERPEAESGAQG